MDKIKTIVLKEWAEVFKNRMVLFTVVFLPLIMTVIPLAILFSMRGESALQEAGGEMPAQMAAYCAPELSSGDCMQVFLVSQFMMMFMLVPLAIPASIASYSIVGEKTTRSLEPLLATPITTFELLAAKSLAAVIPAVVATYAAFGLFALGAWFMISTPTLFWAVMDARWLLAVFLVGPLMALLAVDVSIIVSSRVNDPRVAEQLSALLILPVIGFFMAQMAGMFVLNQGLVLAAAVVIILLDAFLGYLAVQLFQRETILTRWK